MDLISVCSMAVNWNLFDGSAGNSNNMDISIIKNKILVTFRLLFFRKWFLWDERGNWD